MRKRTAAITATLQPTLAVVALQATDSAIDRPGGTTSTTAMAAPAGGDDDSLRASSTDEGDWP
jgi:hypothetical protein